MKQRPYILVIAGPTASGKKRFALEAAERLNGEIVSADSRKVYRWLDIGTAKPSLEDRARITHHLIDIVDPDEPFSAMEWAVKAGEAVNGILARGKLPVISGGTGFYISAFREGLTQGIESDPSIRRELERELASAGPQEMFRRLNDIDPRRASELHENDTVRVLRAHEVYRATGRTFSELAVERTAPGAGFEYIVLGPDIPREVLYRRIDERVDDMVRKGVVEELKELLGRGYARGLTAFDTVGYKEWFPYLDGEATFERCLELMKRDTRRYAKRQLTWFRALDDIQWIDMAVPDTRKAALDSIENLLGRK